MKVIYETQLGVNMVGEAEYTILPTCPVCTEATYGEDTCPFCRMSGKHTPLEYDGNRSPEFYNSDGSKAVCHCGVLKEV